MEKYFSGRKKHVLFLNLAFLILLFISTGLSAKAGFIELNYERLLNILSDNGWRVSLSESNQVLLMPPGQNVTQSIDDLDMMPEANSWRIEEAQDGTIFLFFNNAPSTSAKIHKELATSKIYTVEQLGELKERLIETGWKVEERQGNLFLYPSSGASTVTSTGEYDSSNRIAVLPAQQDALPSQFAAQMATPVQEVPAAASNNQVATPKNETPTTTDSDNDGVADGLDLCPKTEAEAGVNSLGCDKSKALILEGVSFKSGSSTLTRESKEILDQYVATLNQHQSQKFKIVGHTDSTGSKKLNLKLSKSRAESVSAYFVDQDINKDRIDAEGQGESKPIASNKTKKGRLKNRRVELSFE